MARETVLYCGCIATRVVNFEKHLDLNISQTTTRRPKEGGNRQQSREKQPLPNHLAAYIHNYLLQRPDPPSSTWSQLRE